MKNMPARLRQRHTRRYRRR